MILAGPRPPALRVYGHSLRAAPDVVILAGFPAFLSFRSPADARMQLFSTITHITGVTGKDDHGRLKVEWTEVIPHEGTPPAPEPVPEPSPPDEL